MGDGWELEAVHLQFEVFESLRTPYTVIAVDNIGRLINLVKPVIHQHLSIKTRILDVLKNVCCEIARNVNENEDKFKLSYIVIVTNEEFNHTLSKMPIFILISDNGHVFIDMNCSVYKSWSSFIRNNNLPACQFCFPIDGQYNVRERLIIDFAESPASLRSARISRAFWKTGGLVLCCGAVVASFYFAIPPSHLNCESTLYNFVKSIFQPTFDIDLFLKLISHAQSFRNGEITRDELLSALSVLKELFDTHQEDLIIVRDVLREKLEALYHYIHKKLYDLFRHASDKSQHVFIAITCKTDRELSILEKEIEEQLNIARKQEFLQDSRIEGITYAFHQSADCDYTAVHQMAAALPVSRNWENKIYTAQVTDKANGSYNYFAEPQMAEPLQVSRNWENKIHTAQVTDKANDSDLTPTSQCLGKSAQESLTAAQKSFNHFSDVQVILETSMQIFRSCENEYAAHIADKESDSDLTSTSYLLGKGTQELLTVSRNIAYHLKKDNLRDVQDIFEALSSMVQHEYKLKISRYIKMIKAARAGARHQIDIDSFNVSLGIEGDPKDYFWNETIESTQERLFSFQIQEKIKELQKEKKVNLIPFYTTHEGSIEGLHRCVGVQGSGMFSASNFLDALKTLIDFDESNVVINLINFETSSGKMVIRIEKLSVMVYQQIDEDNTSEGMVFIVRHQD